MRQQRAIEQAIRIAQRHHVWAYVLWSHEPEDAPGEHYHATTEHGAETFYAGCAIEATVSPDGRLENGS